MRGILHYLSAFVIVTLTILIFFFVANPMTLNILSNTAEAGQDLIDMANSSLSNSTTGLQLVESMNTANQGIINSTTIIAYAIKYSWLIFLIVIGAIFFLMTREKTEYGNQRGFT